MSSDRTQYIASGGVSDASSSSASLQVWESATGKRVASFVGDDSTISQIYWHEAKQIVAIGGISGHIIRWNPFTNMSHIQKSAPENIEIDKYNTCSVSPDGQYIIAEGRWINTINGPGSYPTVYSLTDEQQIARDQTEGGSPFLTFPYFWSPNGRRCITLHWRWPPEVWDPLTGQQLVAFEKNEDVIALGGRLTARKLPLMADLARFSSGTPPPAAHCITTLLMRWQSLHWPGRPTGA